MAESRISVAMVLDWVRQLGKEGAAEQIRACQPVPLNTAREWVDAALAFAAAVLDRPLPAALTRERPAWADSVPGWSRVIDEA